jgi:hypothetical protein
MVFDEKVDGPQLKEVLNAHKGDARFDDALIAGEDEDDDIDGKKSIGDEEEDEDDSDNPY